MYIAVIQRTHNRKVYQSVLLRRSFREGGKVKHETLANLSCLPPESIEVLRLSLQGEPLVSAHEAFVVRESRPHGHVKAIRATMQRLDMANLLSSTPSRERDLVMALIAGRVLAPEAPLGGGKEWSSSTLADEFAVAGVTPQDMAEALTWLESRQGRIEGKLATRHFGTDGIGIFAVVSCDPVGGGPPCMTGAGCSVARLGGLPMRHAYLLDTSGCPVAVRWHPGQQVSGNRVLEQAVSVRARFHLQTLALMMDPRVMPVEGLLEKAAKKELCWMTALHPAEVPAALTGSEAVSSDVEVVSLGQYGRSDEQLVAFRSEPGERGDSSRALLVALEGDLAELRERMKRVGATLDRWQQAVLRLLESYGAVAHAQVIVKGDEVVVTLDRDAITRTLELSGIGVLRTSMPGDHLDLLQQVEIYRTEHRSEAVPNCLPIAEQVGGRLIVSMLADHVRWHLRQVWVPERDVDREVRLREVLADLALLTRNRCVQEKYGAVCELESAPTASQALALSQLEAIATPTE